VSDVTTPIVAGDFIRLHIDKRDRRAVGVWLQTTGDDPTFVDFGIDQLGFVLFVDPVNKDIYFLFNGRVCGTGPTFVERVT
jgi:hypothetical protein